jgi:glycosyltransferase involved in cell wall biosynthesis
LVVVEALGCCCPVVVGDVPAVHDLLSPDSGWVVAARDKKQLASAVLSVLNNHQLAKVKTEQIRKQISEKFSWHNVSAQYAGMIKSLLSAKAINSAK